MNAQGGHVVPASCQSSPWYVLCILSCNMVGQMDKVAFGGKVILYHSHILTEVLYFNQVISRHKTDHAAAAILERVFINLFILNMTVQKSLRWHNSDF